MAAAFNLNSSSGLQKLDKYFLTRYYITGHQASKDDITIHAALSKPPPAEYVNASKWYHHIDALRNISGVFGEGNGVTVEGFAAIVEEALAAAYRAKTKARASEECKGLRFFREERVDGKKQGSYEEDGDNGLDLPIDEMMVGKKRMNTYLEPDEEDDDAGLDRFDTRAKRLKEILEEKLKTAHLDHRFLLQSDDEDEDGLDFPMKESGEASVLLDVRPQDDKTDMKKLEEAVRSVQLEWVTWGDSEIVPDGNGIMKLQIKLTAARDDVWSIGSLIRDHLCVEPANEYIRSCDIATFKKTYIACVTEVISERHSHVDGNEGRLLIESKGVP